MKDLTDQLTAAAMELRKKHRASELVVIREAVDRGAVIAVNAMIERIKAERESVKKERQS